MLPALPSPVAAQSEQDHDQRHELRQDQREVRADQREIREDTAKMQAGKDAYRERMHALQAERKAAMQAGNKDQVEALTKQIHATRFRRCSLSGRLDRLTARRRPVQKRSQQGKARIPNSCLQTTRCFFACSF